MSSTAAHVRFSSRDVPPARRLDAYREVISRSVGNFDIEPLGDEFSFEARAVALPRLSIARISSTPVHVVRTRSMAADDRRDLTLAVFDDGVVTATQLGRETTIRNGGAFLFSSRDPLIMHRTASRVMNLSMLRTDLAPMTASVDRVLMSPIPLDHEAIRLLIGYAGLLAEETRGEPPAAQQLAADHILDLIALAVGAAWDAAVIAKSRGLRAARRVELLARAQRFIALRFDDPDLSPGQIAQALRISKRLLHRIFAERGESVMSRVWAMRVDHAAALLAAPGTEDRSVTDIAFACGFNDSSHFGRVFAATKGMTPSQWRKRARSAAGGGHGDGRCSRPARD